MKLIKARIQNYRSIKDSGIFNIEKLKTLLVGPNEAGKTALLQALQQLNKPKEVEKLNVLRDYPRSLYNDITTGKVKEEDIIVATGYFELEDEEKSQIPEAYRDCIYVSSRYMDNKRYHHLENGPAKTKYVDIKKDLIRISNHIDDQFILKNPENIQNKPSVSLKKITEEIPDTHIIDNTITQSIKTWLEGNFKYVDENDTKEEDRYDKIISLLSFNDEYDKVLKQLDEMLPIFVLFNNYFKVKPSIHLAHLNQRISQNLLDDKYYDYGNLCLLKLLGFSVQELSAIGATACPDPSDINGLRLYKEKLDKRSYQLNAASVQLTKEICSIWNPSSNRPEADKLRIHADGQYLKVVIEDDLGVEIELDQRSEGFQWLVSFFVVFFAEANDKYKNAILLLDEPGMSLHGLKQREFRHTLSRLSEQNQTIYTTHSPFLVGADELDLVRVVELKNREQGTKVHTTINSSDPAGLLPLQEALGYDLAQSLFTHKSNLILEGLTDYWYIESTSALLRNAKQESIDEKIALVFANSAGKVVYYATILHANNLKIAALLDSDTAGEQAAQQENLVHTVGNKNILRTKDFCADISQPEIEDMLRDTLILIVKDEFGVDVIDIANKQPTRSIVKIFIEKVENFSKYKLAKAYIKWTQNHTAEQLSQKEVSQWNNMITSINKSLK